MKPFRNFIIFIIILLQLTACAIIEDQTRVVSPPTHLPNQTIFTTNTASIRTPTPVSTSTQTPSATVSPTAAPSIDDLISKIQSEFDSQGEPAIYFYSIDANAYGYFPGTATSIARSITWIKAGTELPFPSSFQFAHFLPLIAYVDRNHHLWIADFGMKYPIYMGALPTGEIYQLAWSPDDKYVFIIGLDTKIGFLLDLKTKELHPWPYRCTTLATSPRTQKVAIWCASQEDGEQYAIMEWDHEVWYTDQPPVKVYINQPSLDLDGQIEMDLLNLFDSSIEIFPLYLNAGWSSDGKQIAYFDLQDRDGSMVIITDNGETLAKYTSKAWWLSQDNISSYSVHSAINWSQNQQYILYLGAENSSDLCPVFPNGLKSNDSINLNPACWQVLDSSTGKIIWTTSDLIETQTPFRNESIFTTYDQQPEFSRDSRYITLFSFSQPENSLFSMILGENQLIMDIPLQFDFSEYRWGLAAKKNE